VNSTIKKPRALLSGDTVAVVAPSEPIKPLEKDQIEKFFLLQGFKIKFGKNISAAIGDYAAGSSKLRADDLNSVFADPEVKAIFTAVGGMVASQTLELIDFDLVKKNPKIFAGYSDSTTLQLAFLAKTGLVTFHSPNALFLPGRKIKGYTLSNLWNVLTTIDKGVTIEPQSVWQEVRAGTASGILFGGNLTSICRLLGTPWDPIATLKRNFDEETRFIFFWEEAWEQFSEIMRSLWQIRNTGFFEKVSGMIVGKLTDVKEKDYTDFPEKKDLLREVTLPYGFPILYGVDFGHEVPQTTMPIGLHFATLLPYCPVSRSYAMLHMFQWNKLHWRCQCLVHHNNF